MKNISNKLKYNRIILLVVCFCLLAAVVFQFLESQKEVFKFELKKSSFSTVKGWKEDDFSKAYPALVKSCGVYLNRKGPLHDDPRFGFYEDWAPFCERLIRTEAENIRPVIEQELTLYLVKPAQGEGLFTGYYEPFLKGSFTQTERYNTPLYPRPKDMFVAKLSDFIDDLPEELQYKRIVGQIKGQRLVPYLDRAAIEQGLLKTVEPLVYVDSPIDAFFLHIQGSGRVELPSGRMINLGYAGQNGHKYQAIGRYMADKGYLELENVSMQSIRQFLLDNPDKHQEIFNQNPSYIFFTEKQGGPYGSLGVELTEERSLAIDPSKFPLGLPLFLNAKVSLTDENFYKLMSAQDTGGAIKGILRGDIYFGFGAQAEQKAGHQKAQGQFHVLLPKKRSIKTLE